jgi:hypothetical protein
MRTNIIHPALLSARCQRPGFILGPNNHNHKEEPMAIRLRPRKAFAAVLAVVAMVTGLALVSAGPASASTYYPITVNTANWSGSAGFGSRPPGLTVDSSGVIHLQGALRQFSAAGSGADWIGCTGSAPLCAWGPPGRTVYTIAHTLGGSYADLAIDSNGSIWLIPSSNTPIPDGFLSLEGISYLGFVHGGGPITQIQLASNWYSYTPQYNYGASSASWWEDSNQTVHFSGGVQERTTTPGWAQLIGWIPTYAAPWQGDVYTIVHTLGGTYADLDITPDGRISEHQLRLRLPGGGHLLAARSPRLPSPGPGERLDAEYQLRRRGARLV